MDWIRVIIIDGNIKFTESQFHGGSVGKQTEISTAGRAQLCGFWWTGCLTKSASTVRYGSTIVERRCGPTGRGR
jgi:hypothetical protein